MSFKSLEQVGIRVDNLNLPEGATIEVEAPVNLSSTRFNYDSVVGACTYLNGSSEIGHTTFGRFCSVAGECIIRPGYHMTNWLSTHPYVFHGEDGSSGLSFWEPYRAMRPTFENPNAFHLPAMRVTIGNDVWIGTRVIIMAGVTIGDGAIVGAGAIVTKDVGPFEIVVGSPAKAVKRRFADSICERILKTQWWRYDLTPLKSRIDFSNPEAAIEMIEAAVETKAVALFSPPRYLFTNTPPQGLTISDAPARIS